MAALSAAVASAASAAFRSAATFSRRWPSSRSGGPARFWPTARMKSAKAAQKRMECSTGVSSGIAHPEPDENSTSDNLTGGHNRVVVVLLPSRRMAVKSHQAFFWAARTDRAAGLVPRSHRQGSDPGLPLALDNYLRQRLLQISHPRFGD